MANIRSEAYRIHWEEKRAKRERIRDDGIVLIEYIPTTKEGKIHVVCSYSPEFSKAARELSGRWRPRSLVWSFPGPCKRLLIELCERVYGKPAIRLKGFGKAVTNG